MENMEKGDSNRLYAEVEKVGLPTVHITVVVDQEGLLLVLIPLQTDSQGTPSKQCSSV